MRHNCALRHGSKWSTPPASENAGRSRPFDGRMDSADGGASGFPAAATPGVGAMGQVYSIVKNDVAAPLKLVFLVTHSSAGGAQEIWANLAEGFRQDGHHVTLMALYPLRETVRDTSDALPWTYVVPKRPSTPWAAAGLITALVKWIRQNRPDFILTALPAANILAGFCAWLAGTGTRVIPSHHSPTQTHNPVLDRIDGLTGSLPSVAYVISVSNAVAASLDGKPARYRAKRRTIHNALPPPIEAAIAQLAAGRRRDWTPGRLVVATGRLAEQKNYPLLIRAAALMPDVQIGIVGNGPDEQMLKDLAAQMGVTDRVTFHGHRPREQALSILAQADIFAQVSLFEGHSLALVEAAQMGIPLVVSDVPVQIEGITATDGTLCGIAVPVDSPEALASAITGLLDDPDARQRATAKAEMLGQEASYARMMDAYRALMA